jgi:hypothetical protein
MTQNKKEAEVVVVITVRQGQVRTWERTKVSEGHSRPGEHRPTTQDSERIWVSVGESQSQHAGRIQVSKGHLVEST